MTNELSGLLKNFFSLSILQGLNMFLPLIILPYIVRVLGVEIFGELNFVLSIIMICNIMVGYGFELSATQEISINRDEPKKVSEIISSVLIIKSAIFIGVTVVLASLLWFVPFMNEQRTLYWVTFGLVFGNTFFSTWYFQGVEKMKYITYITLVVRVISTLLMFLLVKEKTDFLLVPGLNSFAAIIAGLLSLYLMVVKDGNKLILPTKKLLFTVLKNGSLYFLSRLSNNGGRYMVVTMIGATFGNLIVGYYTMAEKLLFAFNSVGGIISQALFPYMSRTKDFVLFRRVLFVSVSVGLISVITIVVWNVDFLNFVFDVRNELLSEIFIIVFSSSIFGLVSSLLGYPFLAAFGYSNYANLSLVYGSIILILYVLIVAIIFNSIYLTAASMLVYMLSNLTFRVYYINKTKLWKNAKGN